MSYAATRLFLPFADDFADFSRRIHPVLNYGTIAVNTDQPLNYAESLDQDGAATSHLEIPWLHFSSGSTTAATGASDFILEFNLRPAADGTDLNLVYSGVPGSAAGANSNFRQGFSVARDTANKINIRAGNLSVVGASGFYHHISTSTVLAGSSTHVRIVCISDVLYLFLDGTQDTLVNANGSYQTNLSNARLYHPNNLNIAGVNFQFNENGGSSSATAVSAAFFMDDLRIRFETGTTDNFTPPGALLGTLSNQGTGGEPVKDDAGSAAVRTMIAVPRIYGIGNPIRGWAADSDGSGNFELSVPSPAEFSDIDGYSVIALDDAAGTSYNDLVFGRVETV